MGMMRQIWRAIRSFAARTTGISTPIGGLSWEVSKAATTPRPEPAQAPLVIESYERLVSVLSALSQDDHGTFLVGSTAVPDGLKDYYTDYLAIAEFLKANSGDISGAYEFVWQHGGDSRTFINDTDRFETVVSAFFREYDTAKRRHNAE